MKQMHSHDAPMTITQQNFCRRLISDKAQPCMVVVAFTYLFVQDRLRQVRGGYQPK